MPETELLAVALPVQPLRAGAAPAGLGSKWHGWFFDLLHRQAPELATLLHDLEPKPLAIAPLLEQPEGPPAVQVSEGQSYWLRLALLHLWLPDLWQRRRPPTTAPPALSLVDLWRRHLEPGIPP